MNKTMKLIKINTDHYVVVDDSEIKEGDWYVNNKVIFRADDVFDEGNNPNQRSNNKKITHSTQPLEYDEDNTYTYDKVKYIPLSYIKELIGEVDVENKANECIANVKHNGSYIRGYKQALEDNKDKKYTEEDMVTAFEKGTNTGALSERLYDYDNGDYEEATQYYEQQKESFIQSLKPKTEWEVEFVDGKLKIK